MPDEKQKDDQGKNGATPGDSTQDKPATGGSGDPKNDSPEELKKQLEESKAHIAKLNKENEQRRKSETELKAKLDAQTKTLKDALGVKEGEQPDTKLADAKAQADAKAARILLKSAFVAQVAKDAHDPEAAFAVIAPKLKDVKVDLETETVDGDTLKSIVDDARKKHSFLFVKPGEGAGSGPTKSNPSPDKGGTPAPGADTHAKHYLQLKAAGNHTEAREYYAKHMKEIDRHI